MLKASLDDMDFLSEALNGLSDFLAQLFQIATAEILQLDIFEVVLDPFVWIEFGCIGGKGFQP